MATTTVPTVKLNNGVDMPLLGFGVFQIPADQTAQAVIDALETGYRSLDTARSYMNEEAVGSAIAASDVPRDEMFITTKLWVEDQGEEKARRAFEASLGHLGSNTLTSISSTSRSATTTARGARWRNSTARASHARSAYRTSTPTVSSI
jgi:diketogulonate reductase-like aldo/keto reductase